MGIKEEIFKRGKQVWKDKKCLHCKKKIDKAYNSRKYHLDCSLEIQRIKNNEDNKVYRIKNQIKLRAMGRIRKNTIDHFSKQKVCSLCGSAEKLQYHHWVYKYPSERKHFSTLCFECHKIQHLKRISFLKLLMRCRNGL